MQIKEFKIITSGNVHFISLDFDNSFKREILFNIISIFDERKIISPEQAYFDKMLPNKLLQEFLINHEWENIDKGIQQMPALANALFIRGMDGTGSHYTAEFATILYQLIDFRIKNIASLGCDEKDLYELDKLILKLRRTELLKVRLHRRTGVSKTSPTGSILLDYNYSGDSMHKSIQYNVDNTALSVENSILKKLIKSNK